MIVLIADDEVETILVNFVAQNKPHHFVLQPKGSELDLHLVFFPLLQNEVLLAIYKNHTLQVIRYPYLHTWVLRIHEIHHLHAWRLALFVFLLLNDVEDDNLLHSRAFASDMALILFVGC